MDKSLAKNPYCDGKVKFLQVTGCTEKSMESRAIASARDWPSVWDLKVKLHEGLIEFVRQNYPDNTQIKASNRES